MKILFFLTNYEVFLKIFRTKAGIPKIYITELLTTEQAQPQTKKIYLSVLSHLIRILRCLHRYKIIYIFRTTPTAKSDNAVRFNPMQRTANTFKTSRISLLPNDPPYHCWDNFPSVFVHATTPLIVPAYQCLTCPFRHSPPYASEISKQVPQLANHFTV